MPTGEESSHWVRSCDLYVLNLSYNRSITDARVALELAFRNALTMRNKMKVIFSREFLLCQEEKLSGFYLFIVCRGLVRKEDTNGAEF